MLPLQDTKSEGRFPYLTVAIIVFTLYIFYLQFTSPDPNAFINRYALIPNRVDFGEWRTLYPFVTAIFLHGSVLHLLSNMLFLWVFGDNVEQRLGFWFLPFYLTGGVIANYGQYLIMPNLPVAIIGASGAVAAILGLYLVYFPHHRVKTLVPIIFFVTIINIPASILLVYWFLIQLFGGASSLGSSVINGGGIAYFAHIVGFITGLLTGLFTENK